MKTGLLVAAACPVPPVKPIPQASGVQPGRDFEQGVAGRSLLRIGREPEADVGGLRVVGLEFEHF